MQCAWCHVKPEIRYNMQKSNSFVHDVNNTKQIYQKYLQFYVYSTLKMDMISNYSDAT